MKVKKAIIPAAGLGSRMLPATKALPKPMLPVLDKPTIQYVVEEVVESGIEEIFIITGHNSQAIKDHFDNNSIFDQMLKEAGKEAELQELYDLCSRASFTYIPQEEPKGLGHAVLCARDYIGDEPVAVLTSDDVIYGSEPCIGQMARVYEEKGHTVLGAQRVDWSNVHKYGIVDSDDPTGSTVLVKELTEKPTREEASSNLAVLGRYIIDPEIFAILERTPPGRGGEIQITDALNLLAQEQPVWAYTFEGRRYDFGDPFGMLEGLIEFALRREDLADDLMKFMAEKVKAG